MPKKTAHLRIAGPDKKGIISTITTFLYKQGVNIEDIDQRILENYLIMNMLVDLTDYQLPLDKLKKGLYEASKSIGVEAELKPIEKRQKKNIVLLVTKEDHCLKMLLQHISLGKISGNPIQVLSNRPDLESLAKKYKVPFHWLPSDNKKLHEEFLLERLSRLDIDLIVLARYMQILSPEFCFRYEGRIINIHPSLLPSFPGARPYAQAYHKGVEWVGVTAHFVTTDLDQGPIITQEALRIDKSKDPLEKIILKGKKLEAIALARAVKLFCADRLVLRRGKVIDSRHQHDVENKLKEFYK